MFIFIKKNLQIQKSEINLKEEKKIIVLKSVLYFNVDFLISTGTKIQWHIYPLLKNNCLWNYFILLVQSTYYDSCLYIGKNAFWKLRPKCHNLPLNLPSGNARLYSNHLKNFWVTSVCFAFREHTQFSLTILSSWGRLNTMHGAWKGGWQLGQISIEASKPFQKIDYVVFSASSFSFTQVIILSGNLVLDLIMLLTI